MEKPVRDKLLMATPIILLLAAIVFLAFSGCPGTGKISEDQAVQIALNDSRMLDKIDNHSYVVRSVGVAQLSNGSESPVELYSVMIDVLNETHLRVIAFISFEGEVVEVINSFPPAIPPANLFPETHSTSGNGVTACIKNASPYSCPSHQIRYNEPVQPAATPAGCWQRMDPVPDHGAGETFIINGTTNCRPYDRITVEIVSVYSGQSTQDFIDGNVEVRQLSPGSSGWSVTIDSSSFGPGQKTVSACGVGICGFQTFNITNSS
ncbi:MAG: hypothetical protein Q7T80_17250 [Methanoregula sp.]|nr:hypothetical protein [Methanoregula sp.]